MTDCAQPGSHVLNPYRTLNTYDNKNAHNVGWSCRGSRLHCKRGHVRGATFPRHNSRVPKQKIRKGQCHLVTSDCAYVNHTWFQQLASRKTLETQARSKPYKSGISPQTNRAQRQQIEITLAIRGKDNTGVTTTPAPRERQCWYPSRDISVMAFTSKRYCTKGLTHIPQICSLESIVRRHNTINAPGSED